MAYEFRSYYGLNFYLLWIVLPTLLIGGMIALIQSDQGYFPDYVQLLSAFSFTGIMFFMLLIQKLFFNKPMRISAEVLSGYTMQATYRSIPWNKIDRFGVMPFPACRIIVAGSSELERDIQFLDGIKEWDGFLTAVESAAGPELEFTRFLKMRPDQQ